jgi:transcriptional regulator with GAF, ATPase, and Fis domain
MKPGRFELAHKGTLFLDEVGEIRGRCSELLQRSRTRPSGWAAQDYFSGRALIAATNRNLLQAVKKIGRILHSI